MPLSITRYKVLLSAPSDAKAECKIADEELQRINRMHCSETGIDFFPTDWRRDSRADSGNEPQKLLNKQIVEDADIILAIFKERFGTPTGEYGSGTEEEIFLGLELGKPVLIYFWEPPTGHIPRDEQQLILINELKSKLQNKVIYQLFDDCDKLQSQVRHDFTKLMYELEREAVSIRPDLVISGIDSGYEIISESAPLIFPYALTLLNDKALDQPVLNAYKNTISIKLSKPVDVVIDNSFDEITEDKIAVPISPKMKEAISRLSASTFALPSHAVEVSQDEQDLVKSQLQALGQDLSADLFYLGGLSESDVQIPTGLGSQSRSLSGSDEEKDKYRHLKELIEKCRNRRDYLAFLKKNEKIGVLSLAITNGGSAPAHHVNVDIELPLPALLEPYQLPSPSSYFVGHFLDNQNNCEQFVDILFSLDEKAAFRNYEDSKVRTESGMRIPPTLISPPIDPIFGSRYLDSNDYEELIEYKFGDYSYIKDDKRDRALIRLSFDVVQQGCSYAFPARIPILGNFLTSIHYIIRADELECPIEGELKIVQFEKDESSV
jgi:hypothetical protein